MNENGESWSQVGVDGFLKLAVGPDGKVWAVNNKKKLYKSGKNGKWIFIADEIRDVAVGTDGSVFVLGGKKIKNGWSVKKYVRKDQWLTFPGRVRRIAVDPVGWPWVISSRLNVYGWNGLSWTNYKGPAKEIAVGGDGSVFILRGTNIFKLNHAQKKWIQIEGKAL